MPELPPGEYEIEAWHESLGTLTDRVTVRAGEVARVDFRFEPPGG